jgi:hypothetical protein
MSPPPRRGRARVGVRAGGAHLPGISPPSQPWRDGVGAGASWPRSPRLRRRRAASLRAALPPPGGKEQNSSRVRLSYRPLTDAMHREDMPFEVCYGSLDLNAQAVMTCLAYLRVRVTQGIALIAGLLQQG